MIEEEIQVALTEFHAVYINLVKLIQRLPLKNGGSTSLPAAAMPAISARPETPVTGRRSVSANAETPLRNSIPLRRGLRTVWLPREVDLVRAMLVQKRGKPWAYYAKKLADKGFTKSAEQIKNKYKSLCKGVTASSSDESASSDSSSSIKVQSISD